MGIKEMFGMNYEVNKVKDKNEENTQEGVISIAPELTLDMDDADLIDLKKKWMIAWDNYNGKILKRQNASEDYWLGKHHGVNDLDDDDKPFVDNLMFEAVETFLPVATKKNAEPLVFPKDGKDQEALASAKKFRNALMVEADIQKLRFTIKKAARHWALYFIGVINIGYDSEEDNIFTKAIMPKQVILDPDGYIEGAEFTGDYIGVYREDKASDLVKKFPGKAKEIKAKAKDKMGSKIRYIEWWTRDTFFFTLDDMVLDKFKNPHWNYDEEEETILEDGTRKTVDNVGRNHFKKRKLPFSFISVFQIGNQPHDNTSLIHQNMSNQDVINKRNRQIDKNVDSQNNGIVLSGKNFTKEQAAEAVEELRQGGGLYVPEGSIEGSYKRDTAPSLPSDVYNSLQDSRSEMRNIFGITGLSAQGLQGDQTVRGKIMTKDADGSRVGGGITEYIEMAIDEVFNWWIQLMHVYYVYEDRDFTTLGSDKTTDSVTLEERDYEYDIVVSVKEGSLIPRDPLLERNEAIELWGAGGIDPISLFEKMDFPDPKESAKALFLWQTNPAVLFQDDPEISQMMAQQQAQQMQGQAPTQPNLAEPGGDLLGQVPI